MLELEQHPQGEEWLRRAWIWSKAEELARPIAEKIAAQRAAFRQQTEGK